MVALVESSSSSHRQRRSAAEQHQETEKHLRQTDVELVEDDRRLLLEFEDISAEAFAKQGEEAPVVKLVNVILMSAIQKGASDIHIEPYEKELRVRYRIDGILYNIMQPPLKYRDAITSRIKEMSKLDIAERRRPQEGRIKTRFRDNGVTKDIDFLVSCLPTLFGDKIVMSLLDKSQNAATTVDPWRKNRFKRADTYPPRTSSPPRDMEQHYYSDPSTKTEKDLPPGDQ
jgi:type IV pilus assembly protein PilB